MTPPASAVAMSQSIGKRQRESWPSTRTRAASPATLTPTARTGRSRFCQSRTASEPMSWFATAPRAVQPREPRNAHLSRLLPTSMTRIWLKAKTRVRRREVRAGCRSGAAERDFPGQEARATRTVGEHERAGAVDAGDRALDAFAVGQQQLHGLALVGMAALPLGGERHETLCRVLAEAGGELADDAREQAIAIDGWRTATGDRGEVA